MMKYVKKIGTQTFKYAVAMVYKGTGKFAGFIHSVPVTKDKWQVEVPAPKYSKNKEPRVFNICTPRDTADAKNRCFASLNTKIEKYVKQGFLPVKLGFEPVTRAKLNSARKWNKKKQWVDMVLWLDIGRTTFDE